MPTDRFLIAPYDSESGLQNNVKPWLIPDTAFSALENAYVFRGRVRKRFGSKWLGNTQQSTRLRINVGVTVAGTLAGVLPAGATAAVGQMFSINDVIFTVNQLGVPPTPLLVSNGSATTATLTAAGAFNFVGVLDSGGASVGAAIVYFYPSLPVMGLLTFDAININNETTIGFDTRFAYQYIGSGWERITGEVTPGAARWTGSNSQFFWGTTWSGTNAADRVFFVTNFNETEPNFMRSFFAGNWDNFRPAVSATEFLNSARILVPFKNRLLAFNTWEGVGAPGTNYVNRVRYSQIGSPLAVDAWRQDIPGKGNGIDCPTMESIITVEFIKDRLIVYFERSTWELVYIGNQAYPFAWQQVNTELGAESTFSVVPFDQVAIGVGNVGIVSCNGQQVQRIDSKIPNTVFEIHNVNEGVFRVYGVRDYTLEMVYWTFPNISRDANFPYPNRVLIYNYKNDTWAFNDDSITVFGYFQPQLGVLWSSTTTTWSDSVSWTSGSLQAQFRNVIAGNQEGWTFLTDANIPTNAPALQITNITSPAVNQFDLAIIDHNLEDGDFILLSGITGTGNISDLNDRIFKVQVDLTLPNQVSITNNDGIIAGVYSGGGVAARVSVINITTKEYNFYAQQGRNCYVSKIDFMVDKDVNGELDVNYYASTSLAPLLQDSGPTGTNTLLGTGALQTSPYATVPFEQNATRLIHPVYLQSEGEFIQLQLTMNDEQMTRVIVDVDTGTITGPALVDFELHFMCIYAQPTSARFQ